MAKQLVCSYASDQMMRSGEDCLKSQLLRRWQKIVRDGADVVSSGRVFQIRGPATEKTLLPTVQSLTGDIPVSFVFA